MVRNNGILSILIFRRMVRNEIMKFRLFFIFCQVVRNGIPSIFFYCRMVWNKIMRFRVFFSYAKWFGMEFRVFFYLPWNDTEWNSKHFPFRRTGGIPTEWIQIYVSSVFSGIFFFSENGNPNYTAYVASNHFSRWEDKRWRFLLLELVSLCYLWGEVGGEEGVAQVWPRFLGNFFKSIKLYT
jgi:hypothetical protein